MNRKLKAKMIEHYGKQWEFARALGVDDTVVSRVVTGARPLPAEKQEIWAKKLKCTVAEIFPGK